MGPHPHFAKTLDLGLKNCFVPVVSEPELKPGSCSKLSQNGTFTYTPKLENSNTVSDVSDQLTETVTDRPLVRRPPSRPGSSGSRAGLRNHPL
jgi:hypothetical protein